MVFQLLKGVFFTIGIFLVVTRVIVQYSPINYVAQIGVHVNGNLIADPYEQINEICVFPGEETRGLRWIALVIKAHLLLRDLL